MPTLRGGIEDRLLALVHLKGGRPLRFYPSRNSGHPKAGLIQSALMIHFPERVQKLRVTASVRLRAILELETTAQSDQVQEQLVRIKNWLGEIEKFFLWHVLTDQMPPAVEGAWLSNAEMLLQIASNQLQQVDRLLAQQGSDLESQSG